LHPVHKVKLVLSRFGEKKTSIENVFFRGQSHHFEPWATSDWGKLAEKNQMAGTPVGGVGVFWVWGVWGWGAVKTSRKGGN